MDDRDIKLQQRQTKRRRNELIIKCMISLFVLLGVILAVILVKDALIPQLSGKNKIKRQTLASDILASQRGEAPDGAAVSASAKDAEAELIAQADRLAAQYDYEKAISLLQASEQYTGSQTLQNAAAG